jgi:hypothetical protein
LYIKEEHSCRLRGLENELLRRIFGLKRNNVRREWRKLHNEKLNNLHYSPNIIRVIKSRTMKWAGYVVCMRKSGKHTGFWLEGQKD